MNTGQHRVQEHPLISVVVPVFNEESALPVFHGQLDAQLRALRERYEIIYVDDGSSDATGDVLARIADRNTAVRTIALSRNFGKEVAITAGLDHAAGDAVILMDADGQDPPQEIPRMLSEWRRGFDMVCMRRNRRHGESALKRLTAYLFYRLMRKLSDIDIPPDVGDFRLLSREAVNALKQLPERTRFMKGLFAWIGFRYTILDFERAPRSNGKSRFNYWKLWNFAIEGVTSFSVAPLKLAGYVGFAIASFAFLYAALVFVKALVFGDPARGFPTLAVIMLFLGGAQLIAIGVLGEYLARIFIEIKSRPLYLLRRQSCQKNSEPAKEGHSRSSRPRGVAQQ